MNSYNLKKYRCAFILLLINIFISYYQNIYLTAEISRTMIIPFKMLVIITLIRLIIFFSIGNLLIDMVICEKTQKILNVISIVIFLLLAIFILFVKFNAYFSEFSLLEYDIGLFSILLGGMYSRKSY